MVKLFILLWHLLLFRILRIGHFLILKLLQLLILIIFLLIRIFIIVVVFHIWSFLSLASSPALLLIIIRNSSSIIVMIPHSLLKKHLLILWIHHIHLIFIKLRLKHWILLCRKPFFIDFRQIFRLIIYYLLLFINLSFSWSISVTRNTWFLRGGGRGSLLKTLKSGFLHVSLIFWRMTLLLI